jgi:hypothetical protein
MAGVCGSLIRGGIAKAFSVFSLDIRSLALFRVVIGLVACIDVVRRADTLDFYTDVGSFIQPVGDTQHRCLFHQLWFYKGPWALQAVLFAATAATSLSLSVGFNTPIAAVLTWLGMTSIHGRNECINDSSDKMLRNVLFWAIVLPLGQTASVDARRQRADGRIALGSGRQRLVTPGTVGLLLQVVMIYVCVVWQRRHSREWMGSYAVPDGRGWRSGGHTHGQGVSDGMVDFSAVYLMLASPFASRPLGKYLASTMGPVLTRPLTAAGTLAETISPVLLCITSSRGWARMLPVALIIGLQAGISSVLYLTNFGLVASAVMLAFVPSAFWDWTEKYQFMAKLALEWQPKAGMHSNAPQRPAVAIGDESVPVPVPVDSVSAYGARRRRVPSVHSLTGRSDPSPGFVGSPRAAHVCETENAAGAVPDERLRGRVEGVGRCARRTREHVTPSTLDTRVHAYHSAQ